MGYSERLRLLVGHALIHKCTHDIEITTNIHLQTCASWRHVNQPETLPTYWTTTWYTTAELPCT